MGGNAQGGNNGKVIVMNTSPALAQKSYEIINSKASSNIAIQGLSGILGFPFTLLADGAVIFTHYGMAACMNWKRPLLMNL